MSVLPVPAPDSTVAGPTPEPTTEVSHLRQLIEKQPFGLMRVGSDGLLLAANDVALELLRAGELGQALNRELRTWIVPEHHDQWGEFATRVCSGTPGSLECDLTDPAGLNRTILFHGVPVLDHPDGIPSMILGAQDVSLRRWLEKRLLDVETQRQQVTAGQTTARAQLEQTLGERHQLEQLLKEGRKHLQDLRAQLEHAVAEQRRLETLLEERSASHQQEATAHSIEQGQLQEKLAEQHRLELHDLREQLEQALAERRGLETLLQARDASQQQLVAEHAAERVRLQQTLAEQHRLELFSREQEGQRQLDELRGQIEQAIAERHGLETLLQARDTSHQQLVAEHAAERVRLQQTLVEQHRLDLLSKEQESQQQLDEVRRRLEQATAERGRLETLLEERDISHQRLMAEQAAEQARTQQIIEAATSRERSSTKALEDRRVELESLEGNVRALASLAAAGRAALEVGHELLEILVAVDARTASLLTRCPVEDAGRKEIEAIRDDAIRVKSLAYQIVQVHPEASARTSSKISTAGAGTSSSSGSPE